MVIDAFQFLQKMNLFKKIGKKRTAETAFTNQNSLWNSNTNSQPEVQDGNDSSVVIPMLIQSKPETETNSVGNVEQVSVEAFDDSLETGNSCNTEPEVHVKTEPSGMDIQEITFDEDGIIEEVNSGNDQSSTDPIKFPFFISGKNPVSAPHVSVPNNCSNIKEETVSGSKQLATVEPVPEGNLPNPEVIREVLDSKCGTIYSPMLLAVAKGVRKKSTVFYFAIDGNIYFGNKRGNVTIDNEYCKELIYI